MFEYDNAPDPEARHLNSFPHHKHTKDGAIEGSRSVTLSEIGSVRKTPRALKTLGVFTELAPKPAKTTTC